MHGGSLKIIELLVWGLLRFRRILPKNKRHVERGGLDHDVGRGKNADVAAGAREGNPRSGRILSICAQHAVGEVKRGRVKVSDVIGPVEEGKLYCHGAIRPEHSVVVTDGDTM